MAPENEAHAQQAPSGIPAPNGQGLPTPQEAPYGTGGAFAYPQGTLQGAYGMPMQAYTAYPYGVAGNAFPAVNPSALAPASPEEGRQAPAAAVGSPDGSEGSAGNPAAAMAENPAASTAPAASTPPTAYPYGAAYPGYVQNPYQPAGQAPYGAPATMWPAGAGGAGAHAWPQSAVNPYYAVPQMQPYPTAEQVPYPYLPQAAYPPQAAIPRGGQEALVSATQASQPIATMPLPAQAAQPQTAAGSGDEARYAHTVNGGIPQPPETHEGSAEGFDYHYITSPARIAVYDSLKTAPRVIVVEGAPTHEYIERIASLTFKNAKEEGGVIPYTVIREVSENFIHAKFREVIVSILDDGNTIRFADQGPGIAHKELAQEPGFSSAIEPMKRYIRGVGSGLPIVKDYLAGTHGYIQIEDNVKGGSVVTISLVAPHERELEGGKALIPPLTENETAILKALAPDLALGVTEMNKATGIAVASVHTAFSKMEETGLVEMVGKKRTLTEQGRRIAAAL